MRFAKWAIFFALSFICSWILITTFSQEVFRTPVEAKIITYETPPIPLYGYVLGAFAVGLLLGLFMAIYNYITLSAKNRRKNKRMKTLEKELQDSRESQKYLQGEIEQKNAVLDRLRNDVARQKSELEKFRTETAQEPLPDTGEQAHSQPAQKPSYDETGEGSDKDSDKDWTL
ncbi:MAG: LapA family protein [Chitinivibrionales bacterium]